MNLTALYRVSMYFMLTLATLLLSIDAGEFNPFALLYPLGVAVAAAGALATVDRDPELGLPRDLANFLGMGSFVLAAMEFWAAPVGPAKILATGHWLVYLQLIKMFLPKTTEDDWFLFLLALVQVLVGAYISQSDIVGSLLVVWAIVAMWTMGLFHLYRESKRARPPQEGVITPAPDPKRPYPGLVNLGFVLSSLMVALSTIVLGGLIFLLMPRWGTSKPSPGASQGARPLTGFSDQVKLGQMGEILENDRLVMTVEILDDQNRAIDSDGEDYWRGVTLVNYSDGRWDRENDGDRRPMQGLKFNPVGSGPVVRHHIKMESLSDVIFAPRPLVGLAGKPVREAYFNRRDGTLLLEPEQIDPQDPGATKRSASEYDVLVSTGLGAAQQHEKFPIAERRAELVQIPAELRPKLEEIARAALKNAPSDNPEVLARSITSYLRDTGGFYYSLRMEAPAAGQDPVIDFLVNRKEGHCEYFASALVLLLRAEGIPARLVHGFKGGDWNGLVHVTNVREKHAHSWVEALIGQTADDLPIWIVLDPTPGIARDQVVARVGGVPPTFRTLSDAMRYIWVFYVSGFDQERQDRLIYAPLRHVMTLLGRGFLVVNMVLYRYFGDFFRFQNVQDIFSVKGFFVSVTLMLVLLAVALVLKRLVHWIRRRVHDRGVRHEKRYAEIQFFLRLQSVLASMGIERAATETPREYARRAERFLTTQPNLVDSVRDLPEQAVDAFYQVRFGEYELRPETVHWLDERLRTLEAAAAPHARRGARPKA